jgi:hypothetical protein
MKTPVLQWINYDRFIHIQTYLHFFIREGRTHCSSKEGFIITMVKLATGFTNTKLCYMFGEFRDLRISNIYCFTIGLLDAKAEIFLHGPGCTEQWKDYFPDFAAMIEEKLGDEAYGGLLFDNFLGFVDCKIVETCRPGSGPAEDRPGAPRHEDADIIQESVYSGYAKRHSLKILTVTLPNGLMGALYGAISARENDNGALNLSNLNLDMMRLQPEVTQARQNKEDMLYFSIYGDAIFPLLNCITGRQR